MTLAQARQEINNRLPHELTKAPKQISGHDTFICPICGNGSGADGTGISTKDGKHYTCFRGCFTSLDYLDILKKQHDTDKERDIFKLYNLEVDGGHASPSATSKPKPEPVEQVDYTQYFKECNARAGQTDYFSFRGIGMETVNRFMLGYDPAYQRAARIIIPTSKCSFVARDTNPAGDKSNAYRKSGKSHLFNSKALESDEYPYIFIVEGELDALSVIEAGGQAIGTSGTSGKNALVEALKTKCPPVTFVLSLDNDEAGLKAQSEIIKELEFLEIPFLEANISGKYKDPNAHLLGDKETFAELVADPTRAVGLEHERRKAEYMEKNAVVSCINAFMGSIADSVNTPAIPTGFSFLDDCLDGGFYEGLYIIGAISSLGKTSLCLQIADQMAQQGQDVIIFSLEMSKYELISKSLSRLTLMLDRGKNERGYHFARTARQITAGAKYKLYSDREKTLINNVITTYGNDYAPRLFIHEGMGDIGVETVKGMVNEHISFTGNKPVVLIDYLQILAPYDIRATDKQNTDKSVLELKRLSRDCKIPVLAVSSLNRENYMLPISMTAFKESGAIEYSSDVLLGLQFKGTDDLSQTSEGSKTAMIKKIEDYKKADPRKIQLKILKNRNGATGENVYFDYYPKFNYFREDIRA